MHVLENEVPELCKDDVEQSKCSYQFVPPNNHRRNDAEWDIRTFKEHFIRFLEGLHKQLPVSMWDHLIEQAVITLNLLRQNVVHPHLSVWDNQNGTLNYDDTPMSHMGFRVMIHKTEKLRSSWDFHAAPGYYVGPALNHYRHLTVFITKTRAPIISDIVEFRHYCITVPPVT